MLDTKIDPKRVNWPSIKEWVARRVTELMGGLEEEVLISMIHNYLDLGSVRWRACLHGAAWLGGLVSIETSDLPDLLHHC